MDIRTLISCAAIFCGACGGSPVDETVTGAPLGFAPPPPPDNGVQVLGLPFVVEPGREVFMCVYLPDMLPADLDVVRAETYQMAGGHHVIFSWVADGYQPDSDVHECTDGEMTHHRMIGVGGPNPDLVIEVPDGVAFKAPGGKRLVMQSHYINTNDHPIVVRDAVNLFASEAPVDNYASQMVVIDFNFKLPPQQITVREMTCNVTQPSKVFMVAGHTHEWGRRFTLDLNRANGAVETLYDVDIGAGFRDEPPLVVYPSSAPLELDPGDRLHMRCEWFNDTPDPLFYPAEMCAAPLFYYPTRGFELCGQDGGDFVSVQLD